MSYSQSHYSEEHENLVNEVEARLSENPAFSEVKIDLQGMPKLSFEYNGDFYEARLEDTRRLEKEVVGDVVVHAPVSNESRDESGDVLGHDPDHFVGQLEQFLDGGRQERFDEATELDYTD